MPIPIDRNELYKRLDADKKEIQEQLLKMSFALLDIKLDLSRFVEASNKDIQDKFELIESNLKLLIRENNKKKK